MLSWQIRCTQCSRKISDILDMKKNHGMISVIVPYVKDRGYLQQCLDSIRSQDVDFELIECRSNESLPVNFNRGLAKAKGKFIKMVQDDDWLPRDALKYLREGIGEHPWVVGNVWQICSNNYVYKPETLDFQSNVVNNTLHMGSILYKTDVLRAIGGMDESLTTGEEYDMHLKLFSCGYDPGYIDKEVYCYRMWAGGKSVIYRRKRKEWRKHEIEKIQNRYKKILR